MYMVIIYFKSFGHETLFEQKLICSLLPSLGNILKDIPILKVMRTHSKNISFDIFVLLLLILQPKIPQNALEKSTQCNMGVYDKVLPF